MSSPADPTEAADERVYDVWLTVPGLPAEACERLEAALHRADRRLGVGLGGVDGRTLLILMAVGVSESEARSRAAVLVSGAAEEAGLPSAIAAGIEIRRVAERKRGPGRPRRVAPAELSRSRTVTLPDGGILRAAHEGPTGDWLVCLERSGEAWAGRSLVDVLSELFELPHGKKDAWVHDLVRVLAGHETETGTRYACPCCDSLTLTEAPPGTHAICPVCNWEDDLVQFRDLDYTGGANKPSLREARANFRRLGASDSQR
jgi:hypothetical protein